MKKAYTQYGNYVDYTWNKKAVPKNNRSIKSKYSTHRKKRKNRRMLIRIFNFSIVMSSLLISYKILSIPQNKIPQNIDNNYTIIDTKKEKKENSTYINVSEIKDTLVLQLINSDYKIENIPKVVDITKKIPASRNGIELEEITLENAIEMVNQASEQGYSGIMVTSGFRTREKQQQLYDDSADKSFVQIPGSSEHESGLAMDLMTVNGVMESFGDTPQGYWTHENCDKFGFILRYSEEKKDLTKISPESWHFRYVGQPHATFIKQNNMCYEEYIQYLQQNGDYAFSVDNVNYHVHYEVPKDGKIQVPSSGNYEISSDNCGGYIVTEIV